MSRISEQLEQRSDSIHVAIREQDGSWLVSMLHDGQHWHAFGRTLTEARMVAHAAARGVILMRRIRKTARGA